MSTAEHAASSVMHGHCNWSSCSPKPSSASKRLRTMLHLCTCFSSARCRFDIGFAENAAAERQLAFCAGPVRSGRTAVSREVHKRHLGQYRHLFPDSAHLGVEHVPRRDSAKARTLVGADLP